jgi:hypothetical protein
VANAIIQYISRNVPVLVHSMNSNQSTVLVQQLRRAGFDVTQIPMSSLTKEGFCDWLDQVRQSCG